MKEETKCIRKKRESSEITPETKNKILRRKNGNTINRN